MSPYARLSDVELANLNLVRRGEQLLIEWPADTNIYHMTLGRHLAAPHRDRTALIYESPDGNVMRQSFAEVRRIHERTTDTGQPQPASVTLNG